MFKYKMFRYSDAEAEVIGNELNRLAEEHNGMITKELVLDAATPSASPLHRFFEWNDPDAAHKYRLEQAKYLLRSIKIIVEDPIRQESRELRNFHNVPVDVTVSKSLDLVGVEDTVTGDIDEDESTNGRVYVTLRRVTTEESIKKQVVYNALREAKGWQQRYKQYVELSPIFDAIATVESVLQPSL